MNEQGYRIFKHWMLDLLTQPVDDESKTQRIVDALGYLTKYYRKG